MRTDEAVAALTSYRDNRQPLGHFLSAMLENDLASTIGHADRTSWSNLKAIFGWLWMEMPANAWGSHAAVKAWLHPEEPARPQVAMSDYAMMITDTACPDCGTDLPANINCTPASDGWPLTGWECPMDLSITCAACYETWPLDKLGVPRP